MIWFGVGLIVGTVLFFVVLPMSVVMVRSWWARLHRHRPAPPSGTRPQVWVNYEDMTYDVTESLLRAEDDEKGWAVWVVLGPQHLRMTSPPKMSVGLPIPLDTHVAVTVKGTPTDCRFATPQEIMQEFGISAR